MKLFSSYHIEILRDIREKKRAISLSLSPILLIHGLDILFLTLSFFSLLVVSFIVCLQELGLCLDRSRLKSRIANFNLRYTYTRACTRNSVTFVTVSRNVPLCLCTTLIRLGNTSGNLCKCTFGGLNLLLGAVARGKVDSYDAYFVTRISPSLLLSLLLSLNHFVVGTFAFSCARTFSDVIYATLYILMRVHVSCNL